MKIIPFLFFTVVGVKLDVESWMESFINATAKTNVRTAWTETVVGVRDYYVDFLV